MNETSDSMSSGRYARIELHGARSLKAGSVLLLVALAGCSEGDPAPTCDHWNNDQIWHCGAYQPAGPCSPIFLDLQGQPFVPSTQSPAVASTLDEVRCVLSALRDGTPGAYQLITEYDDATGLSYLGRTQHTFNVLDDGSIVHSRSRSYDLIFYGSWSHGDPQPVEYFDACLAEPFGQALFNCFMQALSSAPPTSCPVCPPSP